ncbi:Protein of unknown function [Mucilaginibacter pineti]|uniref:DUF3347 domain-containing protein n=1 Tax=Mucilaginibacter pineti TaxID=1391627 RepID=A0A1G7I283_9SPHI|nr:DUF3347 domain-containing protein [Mucilaginibacter pineti]SDF06860.1 Protein of unknown function [Mucilaginibacter pineti]
MKKIINSIAIAAAIVTIQSCNQTTKPSAAAAAKPDSSKVSTIAQVAVDTANTADVFKGYIALKDQFLKSDVGGIKSAATALETKLTGIKGCTETAVTAHKIATTDDVKNQRAEFLLLSKDIITLIKGAKFKTPPIYVDYCPMVDAGKGGYWLSLTKTIENPYFPEHMKECGQVKEEIN